MSAHAPKAKGIIDGMFIIHEDKGRTAQVVSRPCGAQVTCPMGLRPLLMAEGGGTLWGLLVTP